jgi:hypothetical protein
MIMCLETILRKNTNTRIFRGATSAIGSNLDPIGLLEVINGPSWATTVAGQKIIGNLGNKVDKNFKYMVQLSTQLWRRDEGDDDDSQ